MLAASAREPGSGRKASGRDTPNRGTSEKGAGTDRGHEDIGPLEALLSKPKRSSVIVDFDGTLAPIVADPAAARAVPGAARTLGALSLTFETVAVVSGRTADFLARRLRPAGDALRIFGLYGMEEVVDREVRLHESVVAWLPIVAAAREAAERTAPSGVGIENKAVSITIHWRNSPGSAGWATGFAESQADRVGLRRRFGRMSVELMPPVDIDKGTTVGSLGAGMHAACFFGDDLSDLDAFKALDRLRRDGTSTVKVAVGDAESPPQVLKAADMVVDGPTEACRLLRSLATRARSAGAPRLL
jgi:trehalose 6-phosphate phosphatase